MHIAMLMRSFSRLFVVTLAVTALVVANDKPRLVITAGKTALDHTPVRAVVPVEYVGKAFKDVQSGTVLVCQADGVTKQAGVVSAPVIFIVPKLAAGETMMLVPADSAGDSTSGAKSEVTVAAVPEGVAIKVAGQPFTVYRTNDAPRPYCWPILSADGKEVTRNYPMKNTVATEAQDHPHHRSLWFSYDQVNGQNFWHETTAAQQDYQETRSFPEVISGPVFGELTALVDWNDENGKKVCEDLRTFRVYNTPEFRLFDVTIDWRASEGELKLGDSKEGVFGFRVAGTMDVDQKTSHKKQPPEWAGGTLVNSNGQKNDAAWGKRADWCDYYGPISPNDVKGIAIFDSPKSFRHPTYWHARTYGLYAANPLGGEHFTKDKNQNGAVTLAKGESITLRYRVYIHDGDTEAAKVADHYAVFANPPATSWEVAK